ncbi:hypothetical protein K0U07_02865 [bacterium]|nr:hypothetical protein [bacterium]
MKKLFLLTFITISSCLFASDLPASVVENEVEKPNSPHFYVGGMVLGKGQGLRLGAETKYLNIPIFQRYSVDVSTALNPLDGVAIGLSGLHYWSPEENSIKFFSRVGLIGYDYSGSKDHRSGFAPMFKKSRLGLPLFTFGLELNHENNSMTRVEAGLDCISATYVF